MNFRAVKPYSRQPTNLEQVQSATLCFSKEFLKKNPEPNVKSVRESFFYLILKFSGQKAAFFDFLTPTGIAFIPGNLDGRSKTSADEQNNGNGNHKNQHGQEQIGE